MMKNLKDIQVLKVKETVMKNKNLSSVNYLSLENSLEEEMYFIDDQKYYNDIDFSDKLMKKEEISSLSSVVQNCRIIDLQFVKDNSSINTKIFKDSKDFYLWVKSFFSFLEDANSLYEFKKVNIDEMPEIKILISSSFNKILNYCFEQNDSIKIPLLTLVLLEMQKFYNNFCQVKYNTMLKYVQDKMTSFVVANEQVLLNNPIRVFEPVFDFVFDLCSASFISELRLNISQNFSKILFNEIGNNAEELQKFFLKDVGHFFKKLGIYFSKEISMNFFAKINFFQINYSNVSVTHPFLRHFNDPPGSLDFFLDISNQLVVGNYVPLNVIQVNCENFFKANPSILHSLPNVRIGNRGILFNYIGSVEFFWLVYFEVIYSLDHNYSSAKVAEDLLLYGFYSCNFLKGDNINLRIPSKYVVNYKKVSGNIALSLIVFAKSHKDYKAEMLPVLEKILLHNDVILLHVSNEMNFNPVSFVKDNLRENSLSEIFPKIGFSFFNFFGKKKKKIYENLSDGRIKFIDLVPIVEAPIQDRVLSFDDSLRGVLNSWGENSASLKDFIVPDVSAALYRLAKKVIDARSFLKTFPTINENANFLEERVDIYVSDLLNEYISQNQKQVEIRKISSCQLSINLSEALIKNLLVIEAQVQHSVDEIVKTFNKDTEFNSTVTNAFLDSLFPNANVDSVKMIDSYNIYK